MLAAWVFIIKIIKWFWVLNTIFIIIIIIYIMAPLNKVWLVAH